MSTLSNRLWVDNQLRRAKVALDVAQLVYEDEVEEAERKLSLTQFQYDAALRTKKKIEEKNQ